MKKMTLAQLENIQKLENMLREKDEGKDETGLPVGHPMREMINNEKKIKKTQKLMEHKKEETKKEASEEENKDKEKINELIDSIMKDIKKNKKILNDLYNKIELFFNSIPMDSQNEFYIGKVKAMRFLRVMRNLVYTVDQFSLKKGL